MRRAWILALLVLLGAVLVPVVAASHTMGHRYLVYGRVLDAQGMPYQNQNVELRLVLKDEPQASIITQTDCYGDFESWDGQRGSIPFNGGKVEENTDPHTQTRYITFHYHDWELTNQLKVLVMAGGENFTHSFHSETRQTVVHSQLAAAHGPSASCDGFNDFNRTLTVRVSVLSREEMTTGEVVPKERTVSVSVGDGGPGANGTTDFNGAYFTRIAANLTEGETVHIQAQDAGSKSAKLEGDALKYRRVDSVNALGSKGTGLGDLKYFGIGTLVVAIIVVAWFAGRRIKRKMDERRLRERSGRKRFRREDEP